MKKLRRAHDFGPKIVLEKNDFTL